MRKRTNSKVPDKSLKTLRAHCDRLWSLSVRHDWVDRCAVCGSSTTEAHHMTPRSYEATRFNVNNGIALCFTHHYSDKEMAPHMNAAGWMAWLLREHPGRAEWYIDNRRPVFAGKKNVEYYLGVIRRLQQYVEPLEFERIVGVRFAAWWAETAERE